MGNFDGWSQGEHLSPEYNGSYTRFSTTLLLRPGRYHFSKLVKLRNSPYNLEYSSNSKTIIFV